MMRAHLPGLTALALAFTSLVWPAAAPGPAPAGGLWVDRAILQQLPVEGAAWQNVRSQATAPCGQPNLSDQNSLANTCVMAKALVAARTDDRGLRREVAGALDRIASGGEYIGRALALGRELAAYVIAADLIELQRYDEPLDRRFRAKISALLVAPTQKGPRSLIDCHERRPNNWGTHCGASRAAVAAYLGDRIALERTAAVFKGYLGDRGAYAGFSYGDLDWQCDPARPVGINPKGCARYGRPLGGVLPDDQRRGGPFSWPPPHENYVYEGLQGALAQAVILHRAGFDSFEWGDRALLRAFEWLHQHAAFPAAGDDQWQPHVINHFYGMVFPAPAGVRPGKNVGWTDWTHAR